ncbi:MAG: Hpt domain-containing protein [Bacteroidales bacterium]|jgi:HPt (histidine-containing phosphotransfer) domain-containing protein|nr:Hpt domain-containing protein [Bacteroidales bacterium]
MKKGYNLEKIKEVCNGDTELCHRLIAVFIENAVGHTGKIRQMVSSNNREGIAGIAHQLVAGLGYVGASRLQKMAREIEKNMPETDAEHLVRSTERLCDGISLLVHELSEHLNSGDNG